MILYFKDQLTVLFLSIKQKHDSQNSLEWFASLKRTGKLNFEKVVSHAADFFVFLIHKVVCFKFC